MLTKPNRSGATPDQVDRLLTAAITSDDPYPVYRELRELGPVHTTGRGELLAVTHAACAEALRDDVQWKAVGSTRFEHRDVSDGMVYGYQQLYRTFIALDPPHHTAQRRALTRAMAARALAAAEPGIRRLATARVSALARAIRDHGRADLVATLADPYPLQVLCHILGLPVEDATELLPPATAAFWMLEPAATRTHMTATGTACAALMRHMERRLAERNVHPHGLLAHLQRAQASSEGLLPAGYAARTAGMLVIAGSQSVSTHLASAVHTLLRHPEQAVRLRDNPDALPGAIEELLRFDPPVQYAKRRSARDGVFHGHPVRAGQLLNVAIGAASHDPAVVADPDRLHLDNPRTPTLTFGGGIHYCLGAALARLEIAAVLPALDREIPRLRAAGPPVRRPGSMHRQIQEFPVTVSPVPAARSGSPSSLPRTPAHSHP
ncbi:cytochrome P450 [Streptomyces roseus]|uniref:cytochrome P450 n=1 Tax=Streptomyces roseus TaxID=66430 RepID=UPI0033F13060